MSFPCSSIKAILLDLDGTLYIEGEKIDGAFETIQWLNQKNYILRYVTNTTELSRQEVLNRLSGIGITVLPEHLITPAQCAVQWFKKRDIKKGILPLVKDNLKEELKELPLTDNDDADYVLIGDMGHEWSLSHLNKALSAVQNGATLTALQRNRFWMAKDGPQMDAGCFVAALEYATLQKCDVVFGKPNRVFFEMALQGTGVSVENAAMVGDDLESDVLGSQHVGLSGIQVKTGKFQRAHWSKKKLEQASAVIDSIAVLPTLFKQKESL